MEERIDLSSRFGRYMKNTGQHQEVIIQEFPCQDGGNPRRASGAVS